jgi:hypothetical protein
MSIIKPPYRKLKLSLISFVIFMCLYTLAGFFLVPWLITSQTPSLIKENLGREASLKEAKFNPYTLELDLNGFEMLEHDKQAFASFDHLHINYGLWDSISHLSVALQQVKLDQLYTHVDILKDGSFNFSDLSDGTEEEEPEVEEENDGLFPVWIGDLAIEDSSIKFEDHSLKTAFTREIKDLNLHIKGLTTKTDDNTPYQLGLKLASGLKINLSGNTTLDPLKAEGDLQLTELNMHTIWEYMRDDVDFEMRKGSLDLSAHFVFDGSKEDNTIVNVSDGQIVLNDFTFATLSGDTTQLDLPKLELKDIAVNLLSDAQTQTIGITVPIIKANNTQVVIQGSDRLAINVPEQTITNTKVDISIDGTDTTAIKITHEQFAIADFGLQTSGVRELFVKHGAIILDNFDMDIVTSDNSEEAVLQLSNQALTINNTSIGSTTDNMALIEVPVLSVNDLGVDIQKQTVNIAKVTSSQAKINSWLA